MATRQKGIRWESSATIPPDTNWFAQDIAGRDDRPSTDIVRIIFDKTSKLSLFVTLNGITKKVEENAALPVQANEALELRLNLYPGMTYNFQHETGDINVAVYIVTEVVE